MKREEKIVISFYGSVILILTLLGLYYCFGNMYVKETQATERADILVLLTHGDYTLLSISAIFTYIFTLIIIWGIKEKGEEEC